MIWITRLSARSRRAGVGRGDDSGFAIIFSMALIMLLGTVSLLMLSQLAQETRQTQFARKHGQTLNSAMAGLNGGLSQLRNAVDPTTHSGVPGLLPCTAGARKATVTGTVTADSSQTWTTDIYYLNVNPGQMTMSQVTAAALSCPLTVPPAYAYLVSAGEQAALPGANAALGNRTLHATYAFNVTNASSIGGQVMFGSQCWDVGSAPAIGSRVSFQPCLAAGTPSQIWYYRADLTIQWYGDPSANLCIDSRQRATGATVNITLQTCLGAGVPGTSYNSVTHSYEPAGLIYQEYSTHYSWLAVKADGDRNDYSCIDSYHAATAQYGLGATGDLLTVAGAYCGLGTSAAGASGSAGVGSGAAAGITNGLPGPTNQLVNLAYFSRCLDVNGRVPANGLITFPCHQAPDQTKIEHNQEFVYNLIAGSSVGTITATYPGVYATVCLQSNGVSAVTLPSCVTGRASQKWQMTGYRRGDYATSYEIVDYVGKCLTAANPGTSTIGAISVATCNGSEAQKWNAPPGGAPSVLADVGEQ